MILFVLGVAPSAFLYADDTAPNLLANGDLGSGALPAHWTFFGKPDRDWTPQQLTQYFLNGRPDFNMGRAQGIWSRDRVYAGKGALLLQSVDPPIATNLQWHGRNPVDGYWLSDSMPCTPGQAYVASGWINANNKVGNGEPGPFDTSWFGPLELQFYDSRGNQLPARNQVRSGM